MLAVRGGRVIDWCEIALEDGAVREGVVVDGDSVSAALKQALNSQPMMGAKLITSVTGFRSISRILELPKMKPDLLDAAVMREAKREMPVPMEDVHLSWQPLDTLDENQRFFALAVPRDVLDPLLKALLSAKRHPYAVDTKPLALARVANREEAIIADIEPFSADFVLVVKRVPVIMRTVVEPGDTSSEPGRVERFRDELARTIKFYNDTHRLEPLNPSTPVFLTGSLARQVVVAPPESLAPHKFYRIAPPFACPRELPVESYAVNFGLAMKEV
jgi:type IV pilus assembly protein PilM